MSTPTVSVKLDNGTGTYPYDITAYVDFTDGISITRGRTDQFDNIQPSTMRLTLNNNDGRFTLGSGTYNINVNQMIQVKYTANAVTVTKFTGYVQEWPVEWPNGLDKQAVTRITAVDRMAKMQRYKFRHYVVEAWRANFPGVAIHALTDDDTGRKLTTAVDYSGANADPLVMFGNTGLPVQWQGSEGTIVGPKMAQFQAGGDVLVGNTNNPQTINSGGYVGLTLVVRTTANSGDYARLNNPGNGLSLRLANVSGQLLLSFIVGGVQQGAMTGVKVINDGEPHAVSFGVYIDSTTTHLIVNVDGAADNVNSFAGTAGSGQTFTQVFVGGGQHGIGYIGHGYSTNAGTHTAAVDAATGDSLSGRLGKYSLWYTGSSSTFFTMDASNNVATDVFGGMGPMADITGDTVWDCVTRAVDNEGGLVFFKGDGTGVVQGRYHRSAETTPDLSLTVYELGVAAKVSADNQHLINVANMSRTMGGTIQVTNPSSIANHDQWPIDMRLEVDTDAQLVDHGNWLCSTFGESGRRITDVDIDVLTLTAAQQAAINGLEIGDRLAITSMPTQAGATTYDLIIEGWTETLKYNEWTFAANTTDWNLEKAWILGDSTYGVLDTTTRLHY